MAKQAKRHELDRTVDLSEIYSDFVPVDKLLQTDADLVQDHSPFWQSRVNLAAAQMEK